MSSACRPSIKRGATGFSFSLLAAVVLLFQKHFLRKMDLHLLSLFFFISPPVISRTGFCLSDSFSLQSVV